MKENRARFVILGLLSHMPMTGYDLKKYSSTWIPYFWEISYGQIYPALGQMSREGLIILAEGRAKGKRVESKTYAITAKGTQALAAWLKDPRQKEIYRSEMLLKLFFSSRVGPEVSIARLRELKVGSLKHKELLSGVVMELSGLKDKNPDHAYYMFTAMFGEMYYDMCARWSDKVLGMLERSKRKNTKK